MRLVIASNPKVLPCNLRQLIGVFIANTTVIMIVSFFSFASHVLVAFFSLFAPVIIIATLALMLFMMFSLFLRMRRVTMWRQRTRL